MALCDIIFIMVFRHARAGVTWIDLEQPTPGELEAAMREFSLSPRIESELALPSPLPTEASEDNAVLVVLHFPSHDDQQDSLREQEVDIVSGKDFIITVRYEVVAPLHALHKSLEAHELLGVTNTIGADELLELILGKIFDAVQDHAKHVAARLTHIERDMFNGKERDTVRAISLVNREFLHLEAALANNEDPLARFLEALERKNFFGSRFGERAARILAERDHVARLITTHRAVATELQQTNAALLDATQNEIIKTLTVITFIILPLELIVNIFGFDFTDAPLSGVPHEFWIVAGILVAAAVLMTLFFARRRWL